MNIFNPGLGHEFVRSEAQRFFPARIQALEESVEPDNAKHVDRQFDESVARFQL